MLTNKTNCTLLTLSLYSTRNHVPVGYPTRTKRDKHESDMPRAKVPNVMGLASFLTKLGLTKSYKGHIILQYYFQQCDFKVGCRQYVHYR